jgi:hypothetical protein
MNVTIVGPNLPNEAGATFVVHAAGCRDLHRGFCIGAQQWTIDATCVRDVAEDLYGPDAGSFYEEAGYDDPETAWENYVDEFRFYPCCTGLPYDRVALIDQILEG